jgi:hypothetical protein
MGTLRSTYDHTGMQVNGITLGEPARDVNENEELVGEYRWDDSRLPNGEIEIDGTVRLDEVEEL